MGFFLFRRGKGGLYISIMSLNEHFETEICPDMKIIQNIWSKRLHIIKQQSEKMPESGIKPETFPWEVMIPEILRTIV